MVVPRSLCGASVLTVLFWHLGRLEEYTLPCEAFSRLLGCGTLWSVS